MSATSARLGAVALVVLLTGGSTAASAMPYDGSRTHTRPAARSTTTPLHLSALTPGRRPRIAFVRGRNLDFEVGDFTLVRPGGSTLGLPHAPWSEWAPMGRGAIGTFGTEAGPIVQQVDGTGHVTTTPSYHFGMAVSPDRSIVGWLVGRLNTPHVVEGSGTRAFDLPRIGHGLRIGAVAGARTCKEQSPEGGGCTVFVDTAGDRGVWVSTSHGIVDQIGPMRSVTDVDTRGRVIGRTGDRGGRPCDALWGPRLHRVWRTCDSRLTAFAPGGRAILGTGPTGGAFGDIHRVTLYADTGAVLASYSARDGDHIDRVAWEDATHVLATVFELGSGGCPGACRGHWAVVRLGTDGSATLATPVVKGVIDYPAYSLPLT